MTVSLPVETALDWNDYELLDAGDGEKLERWGDVITCRPDGMVIWPKTDAALWEKAQAVYHRSKSGGGSWEMKKNITARWEVKWKDLTFLVELTGFKHTGVFPEQAANWLWMRELLKKRNDARVLNLFAYTGGSTLAAASANAEETVHVDAAKRITSWARDNLHASGLAERKVRFLVDDALKFVKREARRGRTYHGIIMDPPVYGRGPEGEVWQIEQSLSELVRACSEILDPQALFVLVNCYTTGLSALSLSNLFASSLPRVSAGKVTCGELALTIKASGMLMPCGIFGRWEGA